LWLPLARARWDDGDARGAVDACERALALHPALARAHVSIGEVLASAGDLTGAAASYRRALTLNPHCVGALVGLAGIDRDALPPAQLATMRRLVAAGWLPEPARVSLHAALAQHADASGHVAEAVAQLSAANALQWERRSQRDWRYDPAEFRGFVDRLIGTFDAAHFARWVGAGATTDVPVFVVGMPRSGTTLTEQILAAHPLVLGAGERGYAQRGLQRLPALLGREGDGLGAVGALDATAIAALADWHLGQLRHLVARDPRGPDGIHRVVDKMPDNVLWLGWIATLFPRAKIVHLSRDPRDIAVSCWITSFAELPWACRLEHIAERYVDKERIMAHWRRVLPLPIHELRYEALVEDPETEARRLLAYLGLPWDAACLEFQGAPRLVRTASVLQVRRPLSRRSVARWRRYAAALSPLLDRLGRAGLLPDDP
jgi:tetratricopeptide (TPR) repeat protein